MKKGISLLLCALLTLALFAFAEPAQQTDAAEQLLIDISGTYEELFPVICDPQYDDLWLADCAAITGDSLAEQWAEMLKSACTGTVYGEEAAELYGDGSDGAQFDCYFIEGVSQFTFDGHTISGVDAEGNQIFSHEYAYAGDCAIGGMMEGFLYETQDADAGSFTYFLLLPDTPATTQHIEFRYGSNVEDLQQYNTGACAYWLAAGILIDRDEQMVEDVIQLFCEENLSEAFEADESTGEEIEISTAEELAAINNALSGMYVLTADIDLGGAEWTPIGAFMPSGEGEAQEIPDASLAFTGTFDGNGHTISNFVISQPESWAVGLFGCASNASIGNFTVENARVDGATMVAAVVGYAHDTFVFDVTLNNATVTGHPSDLGGEGMFAGIVGAGMESDIVDCSATADIIIPDAQANAGIVGGGLEATRVVNCTASGSVTAGDNCYGLGGISGCGFGSEEFTNCVAKDVVITAGANTTWVGGVTGYAGGYEDERYGVPITVFTGCDAQNVTFDLGEGSDEPDAIVGAGFYSAEVAEAMGAPFDAPSVFIIQ